MDKGKSVISRLKNKGKLMGKPLQLYLQLLCQEEFLRRVSLSKYADNLVLKGGLFIYTLTNFDSRATIDVDFLLRHLPGTIEDIRKIVEEIIAIQTGNDFILYDAINYSEISPQRKYKGVSVQIIGRINKTRTPFNIDFGIGDVIVPKSEKRLIPTQLEDFNQPEISTYSIESTIAEKLDAIIQRYELTSRMKDFYDIYYLANTFEFDGRSLQQAIQGTLENRGTNYEKNSFDRIMDFGQNHEMLKKWNAFLLKQKLKEPKFEEVLDIMKLFLFEIYREIVKEDEFFGQWTPDAGKWI